MLNVAWQSYNSPTCRRTQWDMALLEDSLNLAGAQHFNNFEELRHSGQDSGQAFVVIAGQHQLKFIDALNWDLGFFSKVTLCVVGDEENLFPIREIKHPNLKFIIQSPKPGLHDDCQKILFGYPPDIDLYPATTEKTLDWFFAGQVNHSRRVECCSVLRNLTGGKLIETPGFLQGVSRAEYLNYTASAKVIPCPSGIASPDSFRMCEALEKGCVPVVDGHSPRAGYEGFWDYVLGEKPPFPVIDNWSDFPEILKDQLSQWPHNVLRCREWWAAYKNKMVEQLKSL